MRRKMATTIIASKPSTTSLRVPFLSAIIMAALIRAKGLLEFRSLTMSRASS